MKEQNEPLSALLNILTLGQRPLIRQKILRFFSKVPYLIIFHNIYVICLLTILKLTHFILVVTFWPWLCPRLPSIQKWKVKTWQGFCRCRCHCCPLWFWFRFRFRFCLCCWFRSFAVQAEWLASGPSSPLPFSPSAPTTTHWGLNLLRSDGFTHSLARSPTLLPPGSSSVRQSLKLAFHFVSISISFTLPLPKTATAVSRLLLLPFVSV